MAARYALDKWFTNVRIKRSKPACQLSKREVIRDSMKTSTKPAGQYTVAVNYRS